MVPPAAETWMRRFTPTMRRALSGWTVAMCACGLSAAACTSETDRPFENLASPVAAKEGGPAASGADCHARFVWRSVEAIDFEDPLFDSIRLEYTGFSAWRRQLVSARTPVLAAFEDCAAEDSSSSDKLVSVAVLRLGSAPDVVDPRYACRVTALGQSLLRINTFKVADAWQGQGVGKSMLDHVLAFAGSMAVDAVFLTIMDTHQETIRWFIEFGGFAPHPQGTHRSGEVILVRHP